MANDERAELVTTGVGWLAGRMIGSILIQMATTIVGPSKEFLAMLDVSVGDPVHQEIERVDDRVLDAEALPIERDGARYGRLWTFRDSTQRRVEETHRGRHSSRSSTRLGRLRRPRPSD
jgi:hypothetical protein